MFKSFVRTISVAVCIIAMAGSHRVMAQQPQQSIVQIDDKSVGGVVTSKNGPLGRSGTTKRPRSSVTTIFAKRVPRSIVSAITQTPASQKFLTRQADLLGNCSFLMSSAAAIPMESPRIPSKNTHVALQSSSF
jgi:hypothetical protein